MRPRRCAAAELQLEREQPFGNGLRSDLERSSAEVTTKPDPDGRLVRRPQGRRTADLTKSATKGQIYDSYTWTTSHMDMDAWALSPLPKHRDDSRGAPQESCTHKDNCKKSSGSDPIGAHCCARRRAIGCSAQPGAAASSVPGGQLLSLHAAALVGPAAARRRRPGAAASPRPACAAAIVEAAAPAAR